MLHASHLPPQPAARGAAPTLVLLLFAVAAGCVSSTTVRLGTDTYPARAQDHPVAVYDAVEDLPRPWIKVARVRARDVLFGDVFVELRAEARRLGADALVLLDEPLCSTPCSNRDRWSVLVVRWK